ncbi:MAG: ATP-binding protein [Polyangiaceae bacterium]
MNLRATTSLVCGVLGIAIAVSMLLSGRPRRVQLWFSAFAGTIGLWYLAQWLFLSFTATIWQRITGTIAVFLPQFALNLFEAMLPREGGRKSRLITFAWASAVPVLILEYAPILDHRYAQVVEFIYVFALITAGLFQLYQRGTESPSRATKRRIRFLVAVGAVACIASMIDFVSTFNTRLPPFGAVIALLFVFALAQSLRAERLLDMYEMLGRLLVSSAVAFLIALVFYILLKFLGTFDTYVSAIIASTVLLVVFEPLKGRVEEQIQRLFYRERFDLDSAVAEACRRLVHTLEVPEMSSIVMGALERSRRVTCAALYLRDNDGTGFDQLAAFGSRTPARIEVATARVLLDHLESRSSLALEEVQNEARARRSHGARDEAKEAILAAAEVLGSLKSGLLIPIKDEESDIVGLLAVIDERLRDAISLEEVTLLEKLATQIGVVVENSRLYTQMKERDRLAVLGQMAAGLAHEIRNPLGAIKGAAQLLAEPFDEQRSEKPPNAADASSREFLGIILEEVDRLNRVVGNVLDLARPSDHSVLPIDVNAVVRRTIQVISAERVGGELDIQMTLEPDVPRVAIDAEQLRQVLMNLVRNAIQAMRERGRVNVSTRVRFGRGTRSGKSSEESFVEINVSDTGPGISQSALEKIFLPFFTTKDKGTGLGLAISQRIVQGAGGRIDVRSYEGKGSTFTVMLPSAMDALGTPTPAVARELVDEGESP